MRKLSVLIVDDSQEFKEALSVYLSIVFSGIDIDEAHNGHSGFLLTAKKDYDLIISDLEMPLMNGYEFIEKLRNENIQTECILVSSAIPDPVRIKNLNIKGFYSKMSFADIADLIKGTIARAPLFRRDWP
jgi:DNA-binding NarL/FixJ family response regulator